MKLDALHAHVERLLKRSTGIDELLTDPKGNWLGFPYQRVCLYVRVFDHEQPCALVYGVAAQEVDESPELYAFLNDMNRRLNYCRGYLQEGVVYIEIELLGESLDYEEFDNAMTRIADAANWFGPRIVEQFGGRTPFDDEDLPAAPKQDAEKTGLYL
jgi:hypothetical protein